MGFLNQIPFSLAVSIDFLKVQKITGHPHLPGQKYQTSILRVGEGVLVEDQEVLSSQVSVLSDYKCQ